MIDIRWLREHPEAFDRALARRGHPPASAAILALDADAVAAEVADYLAAPDAESLRPRLERFARRHGNEVWEVTDNGRTAFERFLGQG